ncbi:MAG: HAD hydrolase-like protein [Clostridia bacterium]|nr:HAD hydrolase-like protein [Clostridia bacterium]
MHAAAVFKTMIGCAYRMAVFDLDGTLLDTTKGVLAAITYTAKKLGLLLPPDDILASACIGPPVEASFAELFALRGTTLEEACRCFRARYATHDLFLATPYEGIFTLLRSLQALGISLGIATYKREAYALPLLSHFNLTPFFAVTCGTHKNESKADVLTRACREGGCPAHEAVMVGDTRSDAEAAAAVGCDFIGVTYGFGFQKQAERSTVRALGFADAPDEILPRLRRGT